MACKLSGPIYDFSCGHCRTRFLQAEPCKYLRKIWHDMFVNKDQSCEDWQEGKNCGCQKQCLRKSRVQKPENDAPVARSALRDMRNK